MGEFDWIAQYFRPLTDGVSEALGLADDAALIQTAPGEGWAVTVDAIVAGKHVLPDDPLGLVARKLIRVTLSDLAAMGAEPAFAFLTTAWPTGTRDEDVAAFARGLGEDLKAFGLALAGGDTVSTDGPFTATLTALGRVDPRTALRRFGARAGDGVWVSGTIGDGAFGLLAARGDLAAADPRTVAALAERYRLPRPRLALGAALKGLATAGLDVSDGLVQDLGHIAAASGVALDISLAAVPLSEAARAVIDAGFADRAAAVTGGDDYELAFTLPDTARACLALASARAATPVTRIGHVVEADPGLPPVRVRDDEGRLVPLQDGGYRHF
ncbi:MAG: thiamine-phosphate kinase [Alphaproteobacteria bacterium]